MKKKDEYEGLSLWAERMQGLLIENLILCRIGKGSNEYILKKEEQIYAYLNESSFMMEILDCSRVFDDPNLVSLIKDTKDYTFISKIDSIFKEYLKKYFEKLKKDVEEYRSSQALNYNKYRRESFWEQYPSKDEFTLPSGTIITAKDFGFESVLLDNVKEMDETLLTSYKERLAENQERLERQRVLELEKWIEESGKRLSEEWALKKRVRKQKKNISLVGLLIAALSIIHGLCLWYIEKYWILLTADETAPYLWCLFVAISPVLFFVLGVFLFIRNR